MDGKKGCVFVYECVDVEDLVLKGESAVNDVLLDGDLGSLHGLLDKRGSQALLGGGLLLGGDSLLGSLDLLGGLDLDGSSSSSRGRHYPECVCVGV